MIRAEIFQSREIFRGIFPDLGVMGYIVVLLWYQRRVHLEILGPGRI